VECSADGDVLNCASLAKKDVFLYQFADKGYSVVISKMLASAERLGGEPSDKHRRAGAFFEEEKKASTRD
jgi:hypothetical protein